MVFQHVKNMLDEAKNKGFFNHAAICIGNQTGELAEYYINADRYTLFDMASITKIMVTTMVTLRFIEEGKLCLFDTLEMFFDVSQDKKDITIFNLMTHTGGFAPFFDIQKEAVIQEKALQTILSRPLYEKVGKEVYYSCIGYIVLGKILEQIERKSLEQLAKTYVFEPLDMKYSTYKPEGYNIAPTEYSEEYRQHLKGIVHDENARFIGVSGNAGLFSNIEDTSKFAQVLANQGRQKEKIYLTKPMFEKAITPYTAGMQETRGLGFSLYNGRLHASGDLFSIGSFGHTGFTGTSIMIDKETDLYVVLLTNRVFNGREDTGFLRFRRQLHNCIVNEYIRNIKK